MKKNILSILLIVVLLIVSVILGVLYYNEAKAHNDDISKWAKIVYEKDAEINELKAESSKSNISEITFNVEEDVEYRKIYTSDELENIYIVGGTVKVLVNDNEYILKDALENDMIDYEDFTKKIQEDEDTGLCKRIYNKEGIEEGSLVLQYPEYLILKLYNFEKEKYDGYLIGTENDILEFYKNN